MILDLSISQIVAIEGILILNLIFVWLVLRW